MRRPRRGGCASVARLFRGGAFNGKSPGSKGPGYNLLQNVAVNLIATGQLNSDKTELVVYLEFRPASLEEYKAYKKFLDPDKPPSVGFQACYTVDILRANLFITLPEEEPKGAAAANR